MEWTRLSATERTRDLRMPPQTKHLRVIAIIVSVLLLGLLAFHLIQKREPSYHGRTLTQWLESFREALRPERTAEEQRTLEASTNAVKHIGTNAIPMLLQKLSATDSVLVSRFKELAARQKLIQFHFREPFVDRWLGMEGFGILQKDATDAEPSLVQLTQHPDEDVRYRALVCLCYIEARPQVFLPVLLQTAHDPNKVVRQESADLLNEMFPEEAEKAGVYKEFPDLKASSADDVSTNVVVLQ
jgi:HEAT repeats